MTNAENILKNLPSWWKKGEDSNNFKYVFSFETSFENIKNDALEFKKGWQINNATNSDLDKIAEIFPNLIRTKDDTDESFRAKIKSYLSIFSGHGSVTDIKTILAFYTGLDTTDIEVEIIREMVIKVHISIDSSTDSTILDTIVDVLPEIKAAGVYVLPTEYESKNNIFLTNLSTTNGVDKLL